MSPERPVRQGAAPRQAPAPESSDAGAAAPPQASPASAGESRRGSAAPPPQPSAGAPERSGPSPTSEPAADSERPAAGAGEPEGPGEAEPESADGKSELDELAAAVAQRDQYLALAQRTQADFENYRKRMAREAAGAEERGVAKLVRELLPALDNLERALAASAGAPGPAGNAAAERDGEAPGDVSAQSDDGLANGIRLVQSELSAALSRLGIASFSPLGENFDPALHEAIAQRPVEGTATGKVVEVYQPGYRLGESVIRPARVVVAA